MKNTPIFDIIAQLESTSSRLEKEAILSKHRDNETLKTVLHLALNPMIQFYQRKIPERSHSMTRIKATMDLDSALVALSELSNRIVTGKAAIDYLLRLLESVDAKDATVLERVVKKDLACGVQASTVNSVWPNFIPEQPCMLASAFDQKLVDKISFPAYVQTKFDGMRFNAIVNAKSKTVNYFSRNGKPINVNTPSLDATFQKMAKNIGMANVVFDGELLVVDEKGNHLNRQTGNGILNKAIRGTIKDADKEKVRAVLWDIIPYKYYVEGRCDVDYETRLGTLGIAIDHLDGERTLVQLVKTTVVPNIKRVNVEFDKHLANGYEGIILKDPKGTWEDKRVKHQIKFKAEHECDLICVGWNEGVKKYKGKLGSLALESSDGVIKVNSGSGLTKDQCLNLKEKDVLAKIVTVKYNSRIVNEQGEHSLYLPSIVEIREDKTKADSSKHIK